MLDSIVAFYMVMVTLTCLLLVGLVYTKRLAFMGLACLVLAAWFSLPGLLGALILAHSTLGDTVFVTNSVLATHLVNDFPHWYGLPLLLSLALCLAFIWWGGDISEQTTDDKSATLCGRVHKRLRRQEPPKFYKELIAPRRAVWFAFAAVVFCTIFLSTSVLIELQQRIAGQQPLWKEMTAELAELERIDFRLRQPGSPTQKLDSTSQVISAAEWQAIDTEMEAIAAHTRDVSRVARIWSGALRASAVATQNQAVAGVPAANEHADLQRWLTEVATVSSTLARAANALHSSPEQGTPSGVQAASYAKVLNALTTFRNLDAYVRVRSTAPFLTIGILYAVFLLFPWLIYISYLLSKRSTIARETRRDLEDFGAMGRFLDPIEPTSDQSQATAKAVASLLAKSSRALAEHDSEGSQQLLKAAWKRAKLKGDGGQYPVLQELACGCEKAQIAAGASFGLIELEYAYNEAVEAAIKTRQFYNREYVLGLLLHTIVSGVGWYYIFFSGTAIRLSEFITTDGASAGGLNDYVASNLSPVTAAFIGAWVFGVLMLLHNWTNDDLNPRSFFYATTRLIIGMLIGCVLTNVIPTVPLLTPDLVAFTIGIFPFDFTVIIAQECMRLVGGSFFAAGANQAAGSGVDNSSEGDKGGQTATITRGLAWTTRHSLNELDDISMWIEARLEQEGIDSVHALAMANIEQLLINTPYDGLVLADWIDQALLRVHVPDDKLVLMLGRGIRRASDLVTDCKDPKKRVTIEGLDENDMDRILASITKQPNLDYVTSFWDGRKSRILREREVQSAASWKAISTATQPAAA